jgi:hypothetical protein
VNFTLERFAFGRKMFTVEELHRAALLGVTSALLAVIVVEKTLHEIVRVAGIERFIAAFEDVGKVRHLDSLYHFLR